MCFVLVSDIVNLMIYCAAEELGVIWAVSFTLAAACHLGAGMPATQPSTPEGPSDAATVIVFSVFNSGLDQ